MGIDNATRHTGLLCVNMTSYDTIRYDTRCYFNVPSKVCLIYLLILIYVVHKTIITINTIETIENNRFSSLRRKESQPLLTCTVGLNFVKFRCHFRDMRPDKPTDIHADTRFAIIRTTYRDEVNIKTIPRRLRPKSIRANIDSLPHVALMHVVCKHLAGSGDVAVHAGLVNCDVIAKFQ